MFNFIFKISKPKLQIFALLFVVLCLCVFGIFSVYATEKSTLIEPDNKKSVYNYAANFGWEIEYPENEVIDVTIPSVFNDVYNNYNVLQKKQGFDLERYKGYNVKRYTYKVLNHKSEQEVFLNLLVLPNGKVIGGDICSREFNGFMDVFK